MSVASPKAVSVKGIALLTVGAVAAIGLLHLIPDKPGLSHMDFVPGGPDAVQFCDPSNPQFLPVVAKSSPVELSVRPIVTAKDGTISAELTLHAISGKPIAPDDLQLTATEKVLLLIVDSTLRDFQAVHAAPGASPGEWTFIFKPTQAGPYRVFADFTPIALQKEVYASADLTLEAAPQSHEGPAPPLGNSSDQDGYHFALQSASSPVYARQPAAFTLSITAVGGGMVPIIPDLGSFARLTAFDTDRTGMVNLHRPSGALAAPDPFHPVFAFHISFQDPGHYVVWAQLSMNGKKEYVPFAVDVLP